MPYTIISRIIESERNTSEREIANLPPLAVKRSSAMSGSACDY